MSSTSSTIKIKNTSLCKSLQQVQWADIRSQVKAVNTSLADIVDEIDPDASLPFIKITYAFGDSILEKGHHAIVENCKNEHTAFSTQEEKILLELLDYAPVPLGLLLNKSCEIFWNIYNNITPHVALNAGHLIGVFELLDCICDIESYPLWNITAGARSIFMLPKINNNIGHTRLRKEFAINSPVPANLSDEWQVFKELAQSKSNGNWECQVLFFTRPWFKKMHDNSLGWIRFREYLFKACWMFTSTAIEKVYSFILQQVASAATARKLKPRIYITDTLRHLISIAYNLVPGFAPATDESLAPIELIKKAYVEVYQLKDHAPTIIQPAQLNEQNNMVYYSLGYPTLYEGYPETATTRNTINILNEVKFLTETLTAYHIRSNIGIKHFDNFIAQIEFSYFHKTPDKFNEISLSEDIIKEDARFVETLDFPNNQNFCASGPFLNGCIRIHKKSDR